jgi:hypothetical protein
MVIELIFFPQNATLGIVGRKLLCIVSFLDELLVMLVQPEASFEAASRVSKYCQVNDSLVYSCSSVLPEGH